MLTPVKSTARSRPAGLDRPFLRPHGPAARTDALTSRPNRDENVFFVYIAIMSDPVTLRLDPETRKRLDKLAKATERSRAALAADAVRQYLDLNEWQIAAIQAGVAEANRGRLIDHAELKAKWEKKLAAAVDAAR